jgi:hypothetical protein
LLYGDSGREIEFADRVLAHLQVVIATKLRRDECFFFSWREDAAAGHGRSSIWLAPSIPLIFRFSNSVRHIVNTAWIEELTSSASDTVGLFLSSEPGGDTTAAPLHI